MRVGVLASGAGTNLQAILDRVHGREASRSSPSAPTSRARRRSSARGAAGVATRAFPRAELRRSRGARLAMAAWLREPRRRARRARRLHAAARARRSSPRFPQRVINVHPALLPAFPGIGAVEQALDYGVKVFGVTVHFVDEGVDTGPIILQRAVELPDATDAEEVRDALRPIEHDLLTRGGRA